MNIFLDEHQEILKLLLESEVDFLLIGVCRTQLLNLKKDIQTAQTDCLAPGVARNDGGIV